MMRVRRHILLFLCYISFITSGHLSVGESEYESEDDEEEEDGEEKREEPVKTLVSDHPAQDNRKKETSPNNDNQVKVGVILRSQCQLMLTNLVTSFPVTSNNHNYWNLDNKMKQGILRNC